MLSAKYQESLKIAGYPLHQLIRQGHLEIHITLSNPKSGSLNEMISLLFANSKYFGVILIGGIYYTGCVYYRGATNTILTT